FTLPGEIGDRQNPGQNDQNVATCEQICAQISLLLLSPNFDAEAMRCAYLQFRQHLILMPMRKRYDPEGQF
ncbi:MAG: hypothetical protein AAGC59_19880, partial [Brucella pseudogrignonensis]